MKKMIKLLSILGVLVLLGSCGSSSKSVNVTNELGIKKYVKFINYENNVYTVLAVYVNDVPMGVGSSYEITSKIPYKIKWQWIEDKAIRTHEVDYTFESVDALSIITLGTGLSTNGGFENIFHETYLY